jgi:hypothetical protein
LHTVSHSSTGGALGGEACHPDAWGEIRAKARELGRKAGRQSHLLPTCRISKSLSYSVTCASIVPVLLQCLFGNCRFIPMNYNTTEQIKHLVGFLCARHVFLCKTPEGGPSKMVPNYNELRGIHETT